MAIKRAIKAGDKSIVSFKKVIKVGEIAQLLDKSKYPATQTKNGVTFTNNGDGTITVNGTASSIIYYPIQLVKYTFGHVYLLWWTDDVTLIKLETHNGEKQIDVPTGVIFTSKTNESNKVFIDVYPSSNPDNVIATPQLFDLTEMFGAGHEPATVAEFKAKFPEAYYPYQRAVLTVYNKVVRPCARKGEVVQLVSAGDFDKSKSDFYGIDYTNNGDGSWTLNGTCTTSANYDILYHANSSKLPIIKDHIYLILDNRTGKINNAGNSTVQILNAQQTFIIGTSDNQEIGYQFRISSITTMCYVRIRIEQGVTYNNVKLTPQLFDLTAMYGAGNEPKTLADFRKDYPENYYPYNPIQTKNLFDIRKVSGLINAQFNDMSYYLTKNLTQNSLTIRYGGYGNAAFLKEPIVLSAGTYTFSCNCDYDAPNANVCHLSVGKKAVDKKEMVVISKTPYTRSHRLVLTFTLAEETEVYLSLQGDGGAANYTNLNNVFFNIQLEKGSVATDYVPHDYI